MAEHGRWILACAFAGWCACSDAHTADDAQETTSGSDPGDEEAPDASDPIPPPERELTADEAAWLAAKDIALVLERTACLGTCPVYILGIRATGEVRLIGYRFVARPGAYDWTIAPEAAARLFEHTIRRGFLGSPERFDREDVCSKLATDQPHSVFTLRAGRREKRVDYYHGCLDELPAIETLETIERELIETAAIQSHLQPTSEPCGQHRIDLRKLEDRYALRDGDGDAVGMLRFEPGPNEYRRPWRVSTCDGELLSQGPVISSWKCGPVLLPIGVADGLYDTPAIQRVHSMNTTLRWPEIEGPQAAVVIELGPGAPADTAQQLELRVYGPDAEAVQRARPGDRCDR